MENILSGLASEAMFTLLRRNASRTPDRTDPHLFGDAADADASAAKGLAFHDRDLCAVLCRAPGGCNPTTAPSDDLRVQAGRPTVSRPTAAREGRPRWCSRGSRTSPTRKPWQAGGERSRGNQAVSESQSRQSIGDHLRTVLVPERRRMLVAKH